MKPFNITKGYLYFIKDLYFERTNDSNLSIDKTCTKRPSYYCINDKDNDKLLWFIPISSQVEKYKKVYNHKIQKQLEQKPNRKPSVDTLVFGKIVNKENVFLIQNMFPVSEKYIDDIYIKKNHFVNISEYTKQEIDFKVNKILSLLNNNIKGIVFTDINRLKNIMLDEIKKDESFKNLFNKNITNINTIENVKGYINNALNKEDLKLYIEFITNFQIKNDINNIIDNNLSIFDTKQEINNYIDNLYSLQNNQNIINPKDEDSEEEENEEDEDEL